MQLGWPDVPLCVGQSHIFMTFQASHKLRPCPNLWLAGISVQMCVLKCSLHYRSSNPPNITTRVTRCPTSRGTVPHFHDFSGVPQIETLCPKLWLARHQCSNVCFKMELTLQGCVEKALWSPPNHLNPYIAIVRKASAENSRLTSSQRDYELVDKLFSAEAFSTKTEKTLLVIPDTHKGFPIPHCPTQAILLSLKWTVSVWSPYLRTCVIVG